MRTLLLQAALLLIAVGGFAAAQDTGTIFGTVTDPSGAVIGGVKVALVDIDRKIETEATSTETGEFLFTPVRIGRYELRASKEGFDTLVRSNLTLEVQQRLRVDLALQVGTMGQSVEVKAESPLLETGTSSVGQVIGNKSITEMPLNGRDYQQLAVMTSGAVPTGQTSRGPSDFSANGTRPLNNNFLLDGADNTTYIIDVQNSSMAAMAPSVDALQEFKVQNNNFSAEFGRGGGAVINAAIKSGTNEFAEVPSLADTGTVRGALRYQPGGFGPGEAVPGEPASVALRVLQPANKRRAPHGYRPPLSGPRVRHMVRKPARRLKLFPSTKNCATPGTSGRVTRASA